MSTGEWIVLAVAGALAVLTLVIAVRLAIRLVAARRLLRDAGVPQGSKALFWGALLYLVSPVDLLPDPVLLDDIGFLLLALRALHRAADSAGLTGRERE